jgi:hypothetical protein
MYASPDIIKVIKPRRIRWAANVARMGRRKVRILNGRDHPEDLGVEGKIILQWILGK